MAHALLEDYIRVLKDLGKVMDYSIAVTDMEQYIFYQRSSKLDLKITPGTKLKPNTAIKITLERGTIESLHGDASTFGVAYIVKTFPLKDERGKIIGGCAVLESTQTETMLEDLALQINTAMADLSSITKKLYSNTDYMDSASRQILTQLNDAGETIEQSDNIINMIRQISRQTNLLALNATIEAARAGEHGRGFSVIAGENCKLSGEVDDSVKQISNILSKIKEDNSHNQEKVQDFHNQVQEVVDMVNVISDTISDMNNYVKGLKDITEALMRKFN